MATPSSMARWVIMFNVFFVDIGSPENPIIFKAPEIALNNIMFDQEMRHIQA